MPMTETYVRVQLRVEAGGMGFRSIERGLGCGLWALGRAKGQEPTAQSLLLGCEPCGAEGSLGNSGLSPRPLHRHELQPRIFDDGQQQLLRDAAAAD